MRHIGLDIGAVRIGVAVSDARGRVATPHEVWDAAEIRRSPTKLRQLIEDYEAVTLVVGLPLSMDGSEGPQASDVRRAVGAMTAGLDIPVVFHDERLTSVEAKRSMAAAGADERSRRGRVDMVAAALLLQAYLDAGRDSHRDEEDA